MFDDDVTTTGLLEDFIASFNLYEAEKGLFAVRDQWDLPWWDLVRYQVQFALCVEREIYGRSSASPPAKIVRAQSFARQAGRLVRDVTRLRGRVTGQTRSLIVSRRALPYLESVAAAERDHEILFVNKNGDANAPHIAIDYQSMQFLTRLVQQTSRLPPKLEQEARLVAGDIKGRFESKADIFGVITAKYRTELAARRTWLLVLNHATSLERVYFANDDALKTLVYLARQRGIATQEIQHAYMGRSHIGYSYPSLAQAPATLPDSVVITRDTGDIVYPVTKVMAPETFFDQPNTLRDIDVLVAASPTNRCRTLDVVASLVGRGWNVAVKLHPAQTAESSGLPQRFSPSELTIHDSDEKFVSLAQRAKVFIPANPTSTTTFEAVENGAKLIVIDYDGVKITSLADSIVFGRVDALHKLGEAVAAALQSEAPQCATQVEG